MQIVEVTGFGVRAAVLHLRRRDTPLHFTCYPMIHMGKPSYYAEVTARLRTADLIVAEGIGRGARGRPSVLGAALTLSYRILRYNRRVGLVEQDIDFAAIGVPVVCPDVDADEFRSAWRAVPWLHRLAMWCALPVVILARLLGGATMIWSKAMEVNDLPSDEEEAVTMGMPQLDEAFGGVRDYRLVATLRQLHRTRGGEAIEVAVVYGARHVAPVVRAMHETYGYVVHGGDWLTVVDLLDAPAEPYPVPDPGRSIARARAAAQARAATREPAPPPPTTPAPAASPTQTTPGPAASPAPAAECESAEAVARLRELAAESSHRHLGPLAWALQDLSDALAARGRVDEALAAADEAVDVAEELRDRTGAGPDDLAAWAAHTLGRRLREAGRDEDAAALFAEAVGIVDEVFRTAPDRRAEHAGMAVDHADQLLRLGRAGEAVATARAAIACIDAADPGRYPVQRALARRLLAAGLDAVASGGDATAP